jgi:hypothetical protein
MLAPDRALEPQIRDIVARLGHTYGHRFEPLLLNQQSGGLITLHLACKRCDRTLHHTITTDSDKGPGLEPCNHG